MRLSRGSAQATPRLRQPPLSHGNPIRDRDRFNIDVELYCRSRGQPFDSLDGSVPRRVLRLSLKQRLFRASLLIFCICGISSNPLTFMMLVLSTHGEFPQLALFSAAPSRLVFDAHFTGLFRIAANPAIAAGPPAVDRSLPRGATTGATAKRRHPHAEPAIRTLETAQPRNVTEGSTVIQELWGLTIRLSMT